MPYYAGKIRSSWIRKPFAMRPFHWFGHDSKLKGLTPPKQRVPAHLIATIDLRDERFKNLGIKTTSFLRLVHPFRYSEGDRFAYRHINDDQIEFVGDMGSLSKPPVEGWPAANYPVEFPRRKLSFRWHRKPRGSLAEVMMAGVEPSKMVMYRHMGSMMVRQSLGLEPLTAKRSIKIGRELPRHQRVECSCHGCGASTCDLIASIPSCPMSTLIMWGEGSEFVDTLFWHCRTCAAITTHNESD